MRTASLKLTRSQYRLSTALMVVTTCNFNSRLLTFKLFLATRMLRLLTPMLNPCSALPLICKSRYPVIDGLKSGVELLSRLRVLTNVMAPLVPVGNCCEYWATNCRYPCVKDVAQYSSNS